MPRSRSHVRLAFHHYTANPDYLRLTGEDVLGRMRKVDTQARKEGFSSLPVKDEPLVGIGMELDARNRVTKNGYGVFHLAWLAGQDGDWPTRLEGELAEIRRAIREAHGAPLKYLIWAGMGGSAEDKAFYNAAGLLKKRVRVYILDSTDPAKLRAILDHIEKTGKQPLAAALKKCLVVGMAMGMTSYEPVVNLEKLDALYQKLKIDNRPNFVYLTLPGSILDKFASKRGFRRIELQPDNGNSTAGRHSGPLTRGSLYPLGLNGVDLESWTAATALNDLELDAALQLAGFIQGNAVAGRNKLTLYLPREWQGGGVWTKQDFEESLGKREDIGIKVVIGEKIKLANYFPPKEPRQDRCFLVVNGAGLHNPDTAKVASLRRAGYPVAVLNVQGDAALARYMMLIHYTVFGLAYLRNMNFVTQPGVELYKKYANGLDSEAAKSGGIEKTAAWRKMASSEFKVRWRGGLTVYFDNLAALGYLSASDLEAENGNAAAIYAQALLNLAANGTVSYGELTYFGDTRYNPPGQKLRSALDSAAEAVFRSRLKMPADVYEGPAMNHSYHETIIGFGRGFSTIILTEKQESIKRVQYTADYHRAQWLATQQALAERGRAVVGLTIRDLNETSRQTLSEFFTEVARRLRKGRR